MPGRNGTGPAGAGPTTGRGAGFCAGNVNPVGGRGEGLGLGRGGRRMGRGRGFGLPGTASSYPGLQNLTADQELEALKGQANYFEGSLKEINQRIEELQRRNK